MTSIVNRDGLTALTTSAQHGATRVPGAAFEFTDYEMVLRVTMELDTMLPHELVPTRSMHREVDVDGRPVHMTDVERRCSTFTCLATP